MSPITNDQGERNLLSHIREDRRLLHTHPWIDFGKRKAKLRGYVRNAIARVRTYRAERAKRALTKAGEEAA